MLVVRNLTTNLHNFTLYIAETFINHIVAVNYVAGTIDRIKFELIEVP